MDLSNLKPAAGATKKGKRIGRGQGSGRGGTSTKGHKGQKSRSGASIPAWFEGGQMPLIRRIPKFGFKNRNRVEYKAVNDITHADLLEAGVAQKKDLIKLLGNGEIAKAIKIEAHKCSKSAKEKIEAAGGSFVSLIGDEEGAEKPAKKKASKSKAKAAAEETPANAPVEAAEAAVEEAETTSAEAEGKETAADEAAEGGEDADKSE